MILIITNREDITSDLLILGLQDRNIPYYRFNTEQFPSKIALHIGYEPRFSGFIYDKEKGRKINFSEIKSAYYRRPSFPDLSADDSTRNQFALIESIQQLRGFFQILQCFWVSDPTNIRFAENKITQLKLANEIGFKIPKTVISNSPEDVIAFMEGREGDVVIKPVKSGFIGGDEVLFTNVLDKEAIVNEPGRIMKIPSIYQENIKKKYDIRVTIFGDKIYPVEIHSQGSSQSRIDWRRSNDLNMQQREHTLPKEIEQKCLKITKRLGLQFGAIDLIMTPENEYFFLEINPNGQWAWLEQRTSYKLTEALIDLLLKGEG
jgi:glutathione synthase/RimK-type ligase-like ATP-grasp enzyme